MKYTLLKIASNRFVYVWIFQICKLCRQDPDLVINALAKNFGKGDLLQRIREQPCGALISLLDRRRKTYRFSRTEERTRLGRALAAQLNHHVKLPGLRSERHSFWVFPILTHERESLIRFLRQKRLDATTRHNLTVLRTPPDGSNRDAPTSLQLLENIVFLPIYPELTSEAREKLVESIQACRDDRRVGSAPRLRPPG